MVSVSVSVNLPLHHKVQKFSSGTGSPGWSRKKGRKTVVVVVDSFYLLWHYIFLLFVVLNALWIQRKRYFLLFIYWWLNTMWLIDPSACWCCRSRSSKSYEITCILKIWRHLLYIYFWLPTADCLCKSWEKLVQVRVSILRVSSRISITATTTQQPFYGPLSGATRVSRYQKKHSPTHHPDHHPVFISFFHLPRSIASSLCSNYVLGNLFAQPLFMSSLVYLLVWSPPSHIQYISSPNQCLLFFFFSQHMPIPSQPILL